MCSGKGRSDIRAKLRRKLEPKSKMLRLCYHGCHRHGHHHHDHHRHGHHHHDHHPHPQHHSQCHRQVESRIMRPGGDYESATLAIINHCALSSILPNKS